MNTNKDSFQKVDFVLDNENEPNRQSQDSEEFEKFKYHPAAVKFREMNSEIASMFLKQRKEINFYGKFQTAEETKVKERKLVDDILRHYLLCKKNDSVTAEL